MANLKELRGRIASVRNTRKITSAMSRIAAARLRKAQDAVLASRPYGDRLEEVVAHLLASVDPTDPAAGHRLLEHRQVRGLGLFVMTADRGLCGGFNSNVNRATARFIEERAEQGVEVVLVTIGKKGRSYFSHAGRPSLRHHPAPDLEALIARSKEAAAEALAMFEGQEGEELTPVDEVWLVHNRFVSVLSQEVVFVKLLPVEPRAQIHHDGPPPSFEPSPRDLLDHLLPVAVESRLQQAMFDSIAAEIAARRMAMDSATDNATQLISDLTLQYNRERQAAITKELMEIIGGAEALKG